MLNNYIHSGQTAQAIDACAQNTLHIPSLILMEHAAIECVKQIENLVQENHSIFILCGPGNNGGDGLAIARLLYLNHYNVVCYCPRKQHMSESEKVQFEIIQSLNIPFTHSYLDAISQMKKSDVLIDALFGIGLSRSIEGNYKELIEASNELDCLTISIDMPSGIDATKGTMLGCSVDADYTISLDCYKIGQWIQDGVYSCGKLSCVSIGIPNTLHERVLDPIVVLNEDLVRSMFPYRCNFYHKGMFGKALMIGGSSSMPGAISMAAKACYHSGVGTLTLMVPNCIADLMAIKLDVAMLLRANSHNNETFDRTSVSLLKNVIDNYSHVSIGNGMQKTASTDALVDCILHSHIPAIIDADAIQSVGKHLDWLNREEPVILTPHIKEMSDLTGLSIEAILSQPFDCVRNFCLAHPNCIVVLKSDQTLIGYQHQIYVLNAPNQALAKGGSGDLLCGIITGLFGQCQDALSAAVCGVYLHSLAAQTDLDGAVFQPDDLIHNLDDAFKKMR